MEKWRPRSLFSGKNGDLGPYFLGKMGTQVPIFGDPQSQFSWEYEDPFVKMGRLEVINMMVK